MRNRKAHVCRKGDRVEQGAGYNAIESIHDTPIIAEVVMLSAQPNRPGHATQEIVEQALETVRVGLEQWPAFP